MDLGSLDASHVLFTQNTSANVERNNIYVKAGTATSGYNAFYTSGGGDGVDGMTVLGSDVLQAPQLVGVGEDGAWTLDAIHLQLTSPAVDGGNPQISDPDGSTSDIGAFSGEGARGYDLDGDGLWGWWWPGSFATPPSGLDLTGYDCDDLDPTVSCS